MKDNHRIEERDVLQGVLCSGRKEVISMGWGEERRRDIHGKGGVLWERKSAMTEKKCYEREGVLCKRRSAV